ncbi:MAG TPA: Nif11-like leader peptide family RiPP precursor [Gaiellaceae bacterium]|nr:Nif11-like leader peptide family RiPP precursor [Gaiellaceae bacterium]
MTAETAEAFATRLRSDRAFLAKLAAAESAEERLAVAREEGFDLGPDDVRAVQRSFGVEELSEQDLELVSGGSIRSTGYASDETDRDEALAAAVAASLTLGWGGARSTEPPGV